MGLFDNIRSIMQQQQGGANAGQLQMGGTGGAFNSQHPLASYIDYNGSSGDAWGKIGANGVMDYMSQDLKKKYGTDDLSKFRYIEDPNVTGGYRLDWDGRTQGNGLIGGLRSAALSSGLGTDSEGRIDPSATDPSKGLQFGTTWEGKGGTGYGFYRKDDGGVGLRTYGVNSNDKGDILGALGVAGAAFGMNAMFGGGMGAGAGAASGVGGAGGAAGAGANYSLAGSGATLGGGSSAGLGLSGSSLGLGGAGTGLGVTGASAGAGTIGAGIGTSGLAAGTGSLLGAGIAEGSLGAGAGGFTGQGMTMGNSGLGLSPTAGSGTSLVGNTPSLGLSGPTGGFAPSIGSTAMASGTGSLLGDAALSGTTTLADGTILAPTATAPSSLEQMITEQLTPTSAAKTIGTNMLQNFLGSPTRGGFTANDLAGVIGGLTDAQRQGDAANKMRGWLDQNQQKMESLYSANSPEYDQLWQAMSRKDAAAGRNSQYGPRTAQFASEVAKHRADNIRQFTTGTSRAYADALNQNAAKYSGLSAALQRAMGDGRNLDLKRVLDFVDRGGASETGITNQDFWNAVETSGGMPIDYGAGMPDPTEDDVWDWITGGDLGQFF